MISYSPEMITFVPLLMYSNYKIVNQNFKKMKKIALMFASVIIIAGMFTISSCTKTEDTTKPVITITSNDAATNRVEQFSAATFTDPGATATDNEDKTVTVTVSGTVNMALAGDYVLIYSATDKAGNKAEETRTVTVDGAWYIDNFTYTATDYPDGGSAGTPWQETITASTLTYNKISFQRFADFDNAPAYGTISGTTITIPTQTIVNAGTPPADRQFSGSGTFSNNFASFTINYTEVTNGTTATGHTTYVRNP
jgi:hypothetical protein